MNLQDQFVRVPETFEGWALLHEFFRVDWKKLKEVSPEKKMKLADEWAAFQAEQNKEGFRTAYYGVLGHKGDILAIHFKSTYDELLSVQNTFAQTEFANYIEKVNSYVSVVELGMYEFTVKLEEKLLAQELSPETDEWNAAWAESMSEQRERIKNRLYTDIPNHPYVCFYPMNKKRGENVNWYTVPMKKRQDMMREHGMIGRKYAGKVTQVISGSIGFDDWEWGVDLFSQDPLVFKKLVYEMRFDEASALYGEFGPFYFGIHLNSEQYRQFMEGKL
ncbi:MAG: heme-dependent peroxidase [Bdellovibrionales bacterium]|nr:heme-dependent peroxidase [Bdellovibrionales bacterium]